MGKNRRQRSYAVYTRRKLTKITRGIGDCERNVDNTIPKTDCLNILLMKHARRSSGSRNTDKI